MHCQKVIDYVSIKIVFQPYKRMHFLRFHDSILDKESLNGSGGTHVYFIRLENNF